MASSPKFACFFFFLFTTLVFSLQIHARDSRFFNKITPNPGSTTTNPGSTTTNPNEVEEEEPTFIPQTSGTGYGLYGHETGLDTPAATDDNSKDNDVVSHHDQKNYATELKGLSKNGFSDAVAPRKTYYYNNKNSNNNGGERKYGYNHNYYGDVGYNNGGVEKQGMSETRFFENGKYLYDNQYDHHYQSNYKSYPNNYKNNYYHKDGYFGHLGHGNNNYGEFYNNKHYNNENSMQQGYQNQDQMHEEEEFDFHP